MLGSVLFGERGRGKKKNSNRPLMILRKLLWILNRIESPTNEKTKVFMAEVEEIKNKFGVNMNIAIMTLVVYKLAEIERKLEQIESKK